MARFRATIQGNRGIASRLGTKRSGIVATIAGWHIGVRVTIDVDPHGRDIITIYETGGSTDPRAGHIITTRTSPRVET